MNEADTHLLPGRVLCHSENAGIQVKQGKEKKKDNGGSSCMRHFEGDEHQGW